MRSPKSYIDHEKLIDDNVKKNKESCEEWISKNEDLVFQSHNTTYQHNKSLENKMRNKNVDFTFGIKDKEEHVK